MVYHDPAPEVFEAHLTYLISRFNIISLEQLVVAIEENNWANIPPKSLVITFDDGHQGNFALLEVIKKYRIPITIYACAGIVDTGHHYWFLDFAAEAEQLKQLSNQARLERLATINGYQPEKKFTDRQALSKAEMKEMQRQEVDFQGHTWSHPILTTCTDAESWSEIAETKAVLEELLQKPVTHFAYPNGDYTERETKYLQQAGYRSGRTIDVGWNGPRTNLYDLKAMVISDEATLNEMVAQLCGILPYFRYLRQGSWTGKHPVIQECVQNFRKSGQTRGDSGGYPPAPPSLS
ncbi:MAG: polysaccharide deacetylase family protein [Planctomycetes bacterium]|nr:polysaccharide deacetylase family protein [Planctomycetota bacterium]